MGAAFARLAALMARLRAPGGCPWDRRQTFASIKPFTVEETYEVLRAIDERDWAGLADELGDLLLQILFYAQMAAEQGSFTLAGVLAGLEAKLIRRHPHVFGARRRARLGAAEVAESWDKIKRRERGAAADRSALGAAEPGLPALVAAYRMSVRAARAGFEWPDAAAVLDKLEEEIGELRAELASAASGAARRQAEVGDILFTAVNVARRLGCEPESALQAANRKFRRRFLAVERRLGRGRRKLANRGPAALDRAWRAVKAEERPCPTT